MKNAALFIICFIVTLGCQSRANIYPHVSSCVDSPREGVYYSLFVRSFADSDGDGVGDLKGLIQKLDYLNDGNDATNTDLGITGLWLLPIFPSPSYHGYDVSDYCAINPEYGTMEDFEQLIAEARKRNIAVILDLPCNHSSTQHPWFIASQQKEDEHRSWYYWLDAQQEQAEQVLLSRKVWGHALWNKTEGGYYTGLFDKTMPDFNFETTAVREAFKRIAAFWLEKGVAGFRLDAAAHIFNINKIPFGRDGLQESLAWWKEFAAFCKSIKPDVYLVAEVWDTPVTRAAYLQSIDSNFHFDMGTIIIESIRSGKNGKNNLANTLHAHYRLNDSVNPAYIDAPFLTNHDQNRIAGMLKGEVQHLKLAASLFILTEGVPFIYYGEEIGMMGAKPDEQIRTPFLWNRAGTDRYETHWIESKYNKKTVPAAQQMHDSHSLLSHYRKLIRLKTGLPALLRGRMEPLDTGNSALVSYCMRYQDENIFIVHNLSEQQQHFSLPDCARDYTVLYTTDSIDFDGQASYTLAPIASVIFNLK